MNVSQEEYTKTFNIYIKKIREKDYSSSYEKKYFLTFTHSGESVIRQHSIRQLDFRMRIGSRATVERATLRVFVSGENCSKLSFYQVSRDGKRRHLETVLSNQDLLPQWRGVEASVDDWAQDKGRVDAKFLLDGHDCSLRSPALHLIVKRTPRRSARSVHHAKTDCPTDMYILTPRKQRCCRHKMDVIFKELPGYDFIIQPYRFDAGYCKGSCPYRYNPANHHASLQSLIWRQKKGAAPKPCCAPSKLEQLEIIHLDEDDVTKLKVTTWSNMKVIECACF